MAYVGLRKPIIGRLKEDGSYNDPFYMGKAIGLQVTPNYACLLYTSMIIYSQSKRAMQGAGLMEQRRC